MRKFAIWGALALCLAIGLYFAFRPKAQSELAISIAISPYQDIATIEVVHSLGLDKKYNLDVMLQTMAWEDILPAMASNGRTADIGFASFTEFITKENDLNRGSSDPLVFVYPAYVFHGGAFITFEPNVPDLDAAGLQDPAKVQEFLNLKIGAPKSSLWEMMVFSLARRAGRNIKTVKVFDSPINDSLLATLHGSLDVGGAGLTQMTEAKKEGGRVVLDMDTLGFADITGFVCRQSTLTKRREAVENVIRMWFDASNYVMSDIDNHSQVPLDYLRKNSATQYTLEQYKAALSQEYFPKSVSEAQQQIIAGGGRYSSQKIGDDVVEYLKAVRGVTDVPTVPHFIEMQ
jgi:ABC-type nitrate/sulfonate/bicarbonate transport system substrate-binding protein